MLSDTNTTKESTHKRINKSVDRTLHFFNECLKIHKSNMEDYRNCGLVACVEGGYSLEARKKCVSAMINEQIIQGIPKIIKSSNFVNQCYKLYLIITFNRICYQWIAQ